MIRFLFFGCPIFFYNVHFAQTNLVPNPGFEDYTTCPVNQDQVSYTTFWYSFGASPDYFNSCSVNWEFSTPFNWGGYQPTQNGNAYCAIGTYQSPIYGSPNVRELIGVQLTTPLIIGQRYYVSFKVSLSLEPMLWANCASNNIGAYFSTLPLNFNVGDPMPNFAHINTESIITDSLNWTTIFGSFIADSAYEYVGFGNFFDDTLTDSLIMDTDANCKFSYYYFDNVCVAEDSLFCLNYPFSEVNEFIQPDIHIYPNPVAEKIFIDFSSAKELYTVSVFTIQGNQILDEINVQSNQFEIDCTAWEIGLYFVEIEYKNETYFFKLLKN